MFKKMLIGVLLVLLCSTNLWAAGAAVTETYQHTPLMEIMVLRCQADDTTNLFDVPYTTSRAIRGIIYMIEVIPDGTTPPTDLYDMYLYSPTNIDMLNAGGVDMPGGLAAANAVLQPEDTAGNVMSYAVNGRIDLDIVNNAVASAIVTIYIYYYAW